MKATCPHCGGHYEVDEPGEYACPSCGQAFEVKAPAPPKAPPRQITLKVSHHEKREEAPATNTPPCPWCQSPLPKRMPAGTWACPSCQHLYKVKGTEAPKRLYRVFPLSNLDAGMTSRGIVIWIIATVAIILASYFIASAYAHHERRSYSSHYYSY